MTSPDLPPLPEPDDTDDTTYAAHSDENMRAYARAAYRAGMLAAAQIADSIEIERWHAYKDRNSTHAGADYVQGQSSGAELAAAAIRRAAEGGAAP